MKILQLKAILVNKISNYNYHGTRHYKDPEI